MRNSRLLGKQSLASVFAILTFVFSAKTVLVAQQRGPLEPSDTSSISTTLNSFIIACNEFHQLMEQNAGLKNPEVFIPAGERMLDCLDLSGLPDELRDRGGLESAVYLKEVIDRIKLPDTDSIAARDVDDELITKWKIPGTRLAIALVDNGARQGEFLFTIETVRRATKFYNAAKTLPYRADGPTVSDGLLDKYMALTKRQPKLAADTSSPRGTLTLFLNTANDVHEIIRSEEFVDRNDVKFLPYALRLIGCLDLSDLPEYSRDYYASEAVVCLKEVLDRIDLPPPEEIPGAEDLKGSDGLKPLVRWQIPNTRLTIARIDEGPRRGEYLFTAGTVERVVSLYHSMKQEPYKKNREISEGFYDFYLSAPGHPFVNNLVNALPSWFTSRAGALAIWQWFGLIMNVFLGIAMMLLTYRLGARTQVGKKSLLRNLLSILFPVVGILVPLLFMHVAYEYITLRGTALYFANFGGNLVFLLALIVLILGVSTRISDSIIALPNIKEQGLDATLVRIVCRLLGIVVATIVFLEGGQYLGFPVTTLLASAGIGGLAIALSAQGMIKGLFGTITILLDKPFKVGERIVVNDHDGFVEEIGLRSTKIRTFLDDHLVSIPNDQMADSEVENIGRRHHIQKRLDFIIPIDTPQAKVEKAIDLVRAALNNHEGMDSEHPPRVYFDEIRSDGFRIRAIYWYHPPNRWECEAFGQKLHLEILLAFEEHGVQLSLPFRHSFWKEDDRQGPLDVCLNLDEKTLKKQGMSNSG